MAETDSTRQFTAAEVRSTAALIRHVYSHWSVWAEMLDAFAARLENQERGGCVCGYGAFMTSHGQPFVSDVVHTQDCPVLAAREEGRRAVLAEVFNAVGGPPLALDDTCIFCHDDSPKMVVTHKPDCLWLRAQSAR